MGAVVPWVARGGQPRFRPPFSRESRVVQRRKVLASLTRSRLMELARALGVPGLGGKSKDEIVRGMATARSVKTRQVLEAMARDELKAACRATGLDDGGRAKGDAWSAVAPPDSGRNCTVPAGLMSGELNADL